MKRLTVFDAAVASFVVVLIPVAYGTYRLFRTPQPVVASVRRVEITKEELRIGGPSLVAKMKVTGSGLRPMLRASIDGTPAIGFVFENPNSADLLVGAVPPGSHDLILFDGVQEVARAPKAVTIEAAVSRHATVRIRLDSPPEVVQLVKVGDRDGFGNPGLALVSAVEKDWLTLSLNATVTDAGWQYRGETITPGATLTIATARYILKGTVVSVVEDKP